MCLYGRTVAILVASNQCLIGTELGPWHSLPQVSNWMLHSAGFQASAMVVPVP